MRRWHFYVMGAIALAYGVIAMAEYVIVSYGLWVGWLEMYSAEQVQWLRALPNWVHGVWGFHATIALVGALCLLAHLRAAVWMLAFATLSLIVLYVWMVALATPSVIALVGGGWLAWATLGLVLLLSLLIYVYARQEKRAGEVL
ncbi:hypothetical protein MWU52_02635 [Jannaschia sp. S6380]|uniref:hypothetical protein n=1 Tax=Jannaschia sp. S6380 TaxID=2926408 RepID=UPI001FF1C1AC|nr:hypothetical protein [Jannaschia sp. S6380]MCK0166440.1 hypothetical protein [Jannaschia sp. S6380]